MYRNPLTVALNRFAFYNGVMMRLLLSLVFVYAACDKPAPRPPKTNKGQAKALAKVRADAIGNTKDAKLRQLLADHWEHVIVNSPVWATMLGYEIARDRIGDNSLTAIAEYRNKRRALYLRAKSLRGTLPEGSQDWITLELLLGELEAAMASETCQFEKWSVSARGNPLSSFSYLPQAHDIKTTADADDLLTRYSLIPKSIQTTVENMKLGLAAGLVADQKTVSLTITQLERELAKPSGQLALDEVQEKLPKSWSAATRDKYKAKFAASVDSGIRGALREYTVFLKQQILPNARTNGGLTPFPKCYAAMILQYTDRKATPQELHALGMSELARIHHEMLAIGGKKYGVTTPKALFAKINSDTSLFYDSKQELLADAKAIVAEADAKLASYFAELPRAKVTVRAVPDHLAPYTTIAYYRQPEPNGEKPGEYFVNTFEPKTRPKYQMRALSFHEAVPGHHLQIAIAQQQKRLPAFRKYGGYTSYVEGWGLYSERLSDEMGLYPTPEDKLGMLAFDAWRAARLVVDTGIHSMGWSREKAEKFMEENTGLASNNIKNEVDRYINTPGQALAYKVGQLEFLRLREQAKQQLGKKFQIGAFHKAALENGAISLPLLRRMIGNWVTSQRKN